MKHSTYCTVEAPKSHCPQCDNGLILLQDIKIRRNKPMFYVCFDCERIFEVGRDEVYRSNLIYSRNDMAIERKLEEDKKHEE